NVPAAQVVCAPVEREVAARAARGERFDLILLDPPREGARALVAQLPALGAERIVYVSGDPMTLARDVRALVAARYTLARATAVDLMPQTYHVETVAVLDRTT